VQSSIKEGFPVLFYKRCEKNPKIAEAIPDSEIPSSHIVNKTKTKASTRLFKSVQLLALAVGVLGSTAAAALQFKPLGYTHSIDDYADWNVSVPITAPPGIKGLQPHISLEYNSGVASGQGTVNGPGSAHHNYRNWAVKGLYTIGACERKTLAGDFICFKNGHTETLYKYVTGGYRIAGNADRNFAQDQRIYTDNNNHPTYGAVSYRFEDHETGTTMYFRNFGGQHLLTYVVDRFGNNMAYTYTTFGPSGSQWYVIHTISYAEAKIKLNFKYAKIGQFYPNVPQSIHLKNGNGNGAITTWTYLLNQTVQSYGSGTVRDYLELRKIRKCVGNVTGNGNCGSESVSDRLDLVYRQPSTSSNQSGLGGLRDVEQPMGGSGSNQKGHIVRFTYEVSINTGSHPNQARRQIYQYTRTANAQYSRTYYDFKTPVAHPYAPTRQLYQDQWSRIIDWKVGTSLNHHLTHYRQVSGGNPHIGLLTYESNFLSNKTSAFYTGQTELFLGQSFYTYVSGRRQLSSSIKDNWINNTFANREEKQISYTGNINTSAHPIYKQSVINSSMPSGDFALGNSRINSTIRHTYHGGSTSQYHDYVNTISRTNCATNSTTYQCPDTGLRHQYSYRSSDGALNCLTVRGRLNLTTTTSDVSKTCYTYSSDGRGNIATKTQEDLASGGGANNTRTITNTYASSGLELTKVSVGSLTTHYQNYNRFCGKYDKITRASATNGSTSNGMVMTFEYDDLCRIEKSITDGNTKTIQIATCAAVGCSAASAAAYRVQESISPESAGATKWSYHADSGRVLRVLEQVDTNLAGSGGTKNRVSQDNVWSRMGRLVSTEAPYFSGEAKVGKTSYTYDNYGRHQTVTSASGLKTTYTYSKTSDGNLKIDSANTESNGSTTQLTSTVVRAPLGVHSSSTNNDGVIERINNSKSFGGTSNNYAEEFTSVRDSAGTNLTHTVLSDQFGNRVQETGTEKGRVEREFNGFGNKRFERQIGASNRTLERENLYDQYGRVRHYVMGDSGYSGFAGINELGWYIYDDCQTLPAGYSFNPSVFRQNNVAGKTCYGWKTTGLGFMGGERNFAANETRYLRAKGVADREFQQIGARSFQFDYAYNANDQLETMTYPKDSKGVRFQIKYEYASDGQLLRIRNLTKNNIVYEAKKSYNVSGGNYQDEDSLNSDNIFRYRKYSGATGRMLETDINAGTNSGGTPQDRHNQVYAYNKSPNEMSSKNDTIGSGAPATLHNETYGYDDLSQLKTVTATGLSDTTTFLKGGDVNVNNGKTHTYTNISTGSASVRRLTAVGSDTLSYDGLGRLTAINYSGSIDDISDIEYHPDNTPGSIKTRHGRTRMVYGKAQDMVYMHEPLGDNKVVKSWFIKGKMMELRESYESGQPVSVAARYYVYANPDQGGQPVAAYVDNHVQSENTWLVFASAKQSSDYQNNAALAGAQKAIDRNTNGVWNGNASLNTITHTNTGSQNWWQGDLGRSRSLDYITLRNRINCCPGRLKGFHILLSDVDLDGMSLADAKNAANSWIYEKGEVKTASNDSSYTWVVPDGKRGRYVMVYKEANNVLSLAEVQAFGPDVTGLVIDDEVDIPSNATRSGTWDFEDSIVVPYSGETSHTDTAGGGTHQHYLTGLNYTVRSGDNFSTWVYLNPANPAKTIQFQIRIGNDWGHRIHWGQNTVPWAGTYMGAIPANSNGRWVKFNANLSQFGSGINTGENITGVAWTVHNGGQAFFDRTIIGQGHHQEGLGNDALRHSVYNNNNDRLRIESNNHVNIGSNWTISASFSDLVNGTSWRTLFRGKSGDHQIIINSAGLLGSYGNGVSGFSGFKSCGYNAWQLDNGQHHTITARGSGSQTRFYVDGVEVCSINYKSTSDIYSIGNYQGGGQRFAAELDNVQIHTRALTDEEIRQVANGVKVSSGLAAYYNFEETSSQYYQDKSGNNRHATSTSVTTSTY
jgi:hypothetical protein